VATWVKPMAELASALPHIDKATRDVIGEWLQRRCLPVFNVGEQEFEVHWNDEVTDRWHVLIEMNVGNHLAVLTLDSLAALDPLLVGEPFTLMPNALRDLAVQRFAARILTFAPPALANGLELRSIHWDGRGLPDWTCRLSFLLRRRGDGTELQGTLLFDSAAGLRWLHGILPIDTVSRQVRSHLTVPLTLSLGQSKIRSGVLETLAAGDVVWIETGSITRAGIAVQVMAPLVRCSWRARARRDSLKIHSTAEVAPAKLQTSSPLQASIQPGAGAQAMEARQWQLDVPVTFDLGEVHLSVADLERLQPGHVIELSQDVAAATVSLRVASRHIAEGTLISVGGRLGVRIGTVLRQNEAGASQL
jgi:type III secretion system YscQ/HrcQ family protein